MDELKSSDNENVVNHNIDTEISKNEFEEIAVNPLSTKDMQILQDRSSIESGLMNPEKSLSNPFYLGFTNHYERFFKKFKHIKELYITNEKKDRRIMSTIYYLIISRKKMKYLVKSGSKHKEVYFDFEKKGLFNKDNVEIENEMSKNKFFGNIKVIGNQVKNNLAFVFETWLKGGV